MISVAEKQLIEQFKEFRVNKTELLFAIKKPKTNLILNDDTKQQLSKEELEKGVLVVVGDADFTKPGDKIVIKPNAQVISFGFLSDFYDIYITNVYNVAFIYPTNYNITTKDGKSN